MFTKIQSILTIMTVKNPCTCLLLRTTLSNENLENREKQNKTIARKLLLFLGSYSWNPQKIYLEDLLDVL